MRAATPPAADTAWQLTYPWKQLNVSGYARSSAASFSWISRDSRHAALLDNITFVVMTSGMDSTHAVRLEAARRGWLVRSHRHFGHRPKPHALSSTHFLSSSCAHPGCRAVVTRVRARDEALAAPRLTDRPARPARAPESGGAGSPQRSLGGAMVPDRRR